MTLTALDNIDKMPHIVTEFDAFGCRYDPSSRAGHYESYFIRANHSSKAQAFWIRYTLFAAKGGNQAPYGELWAIYFDGTTNVVCRETVAIDQCEVAKHGLSVTMGDASLIADTIHKDTAHKGHAKGSSKTDGNKISWQLDYEGDSQPLLFLPENYYQRSLPKAKSVVGSPNVNFNGGLTIGSNVIEVKNWQGSVNHNWGPKHTDRYAWGQVAGFDNFPDSFLEIVTARVKIGPVLSPALTILVLRIVDREYALNTFWHGMKAKAHYNNFTWQFATKQHNVAIEGNISAAKNCFARLLYPNPPGDTNYCYNSKIAQCELQVMEVGKPKLTLTTAHRAAFEILTPDFIDL